MAVYSLVVGKFVYGQLKLRQLPSIMVEGLLAAAPVMMILCAASVFSYYLSWESIPQKVASFIISISSSKYVFLLIVNVFLLICGMFLDGTACMVVVAPLLIPVASGYGIDLIHLGMVMCMNLFIGNITPPFGTYIFMAAGTIQAKVEDVCRELLPFILILIAVLMICTYLQAVVLFIPNLIFG